jgi:lipopolysaccharide transport system permease protein
VRLTGGIASLLWRQRDLIAQLSRREIIGRYRGSVFGLAWSLLHPLVMLGVYVFVFGVVFGARWGQATADHAEFGIRVFGGMIVHGLFAENIVRAPTLVLHNPQYVKKVVFPLEILPVVAMLTALFHALVSLAILFAAHAVKTGDPHITALWLPVLWAPFVLLTLGVGWFLAAVSVFLRDVAQLVPIVVTILLFLSPVFYPVEAVPGIVRPLMYLNPLTFPIEQTRSALLAGNPPDAVGLLGYCLAAAVVLAAGYGFFRKSRRAFADVV